MFFSQARGRPKAAQHHKAFKQTANDIWELGPPHPQDLAKSQIQTHGNQTSIWRKTTSDCMYTVLTYLAHSGLIHFLPETWILLSYTSPSRITPTVRVWHATGINQGSWGQTGPHYSKAPTLVEKMGGKFIIKQNNCKLWLFIYVSWVKSLLRFGFIYLKIFSFWGIAEQQTVLW